MTEELVLIPKNTYQYLTSLNKTPEKHVEKKTKVTVSHQQNEDLEGTIQTLPKNLRNRAKGLLNFIQDRGGKTLGISGGQIQINGKTYGHMIGFLRNAVSPYTLKHKPKGMKEFYVALKKLNAPLYFTPNKFVLPGERNVQKWIKIHKKL